MEGKRRRRAGKTGGAYKRIPSELDIRSVDRKWEVGDPGPGPLLNQKLLINQTLASELEPEIAR